MNTYDETWRAFMQAQLRYAQAWLEMGDALAQYWTSCTTWGHNGSRSAR